jgi:hypothetical protein
MTWEETVESKREPLLSVVLGLIAAIGLKEGVAIERISKPLHRKVLRLLRTAESAVRRLIVAAARNIVVEPEPLRERSASVKPKTSTPGKEGEAKPRRKRRPLFNMFDALKCLGRRRPKKKRRPMPPFTLVMLGYDRGRSTIERFDYPDLGPAPSQPAATKQEPIDDGTVNAAPLIRRLLAVLDAVQDVQSYALRLARWHAKPKEDRRPERWSPLRPGRPPGYRQKNIHEVDELLKECDWLARLGNPPLDDTS